MFAKTVSHAPVFARIPGSHHPDTRLRLLPGFRDPGSVLILGQVKQYGNPYLICIAKVTVRCRQNEVSSIQIQHKRQPIARLLGRGMGCRLWVQSFTYILPQSAHWCVRYIVILDRIITALDYIWYIGCSYMGALGYVGLRHGDWFNINMSSNQYRKSHCGDATLVRSSYLHNGNSYTGKIAFLYWIGDLWY